jgi:hypothetical protein
VRNCTGRYVHVFWFIVVFLKFFLVDWRRAFVV